MLDTIVLSLNEGMFYINEPDRFEPSARWVLKADAPLGGRGYVISKQNPTSTELKNGYYKPRLTLTNRFGHSGKREVMLKIELSLPKLLFGNNFDELTMVDFETTTHLLISRLKDMGVSVFTQLLCNAQVSAVHYSKNIPLTDGMTPNYLINKIKEANIKLSLDTNQTDYRNGGYSYKWHSNSYEVAFYDKIKDLATANISEKRALENDNSLQLSLLDTLKERRQLEILRIEVRLNRRQKIKQLFSILGITADLTFKSIYSSTISQKVLLYYLEEIERQRPAILDYRSKSHRELLADLIINNPTFCPNKIFQLFGLKQALDELNLRDLRGMFSRKSQRSWYRLISQVKEVHLSKQLSPFTTIRENLNSFIPLKLLDYESIMINNDKYH